MTEQWRRRRLLGAMFGAPGALGMRAATRPAAAAPKLRVLVAGGHPGDPEYGCGGTIARFVAERHAVTMLYLSRGEAPNEDPDCRTTGSGAERLREASNAARLLGADIAFLDQCDGHAVVDDAAYGATARLVHDLAPDVIFDHWPVDDHPDHRAVSSLVYQAWLNLNRQAAFYYYEVSTGEDTQLFHPTDFVDISAVEPVKRSACYAHASQSPDRYYALQTLIARMRGAEFGCALAEAFVRHPRSRPLRLP